MEKTLFGIKFTSHLKYLYDSFLFPAREAGHLWDCPLGKSTVKKRSTEGKIIMAGKCSRLWGSKKNSPKKICCKSWSDISVTSSALKGHAATEAPMTGKVKGAMSELVFSGVTRSWKTYAFHRRKAITPILGVSNEVWDGFSMFSMEKAKLVRIQPAGTVIHPSEMLNCTSE